MVHDDVSAAIVAGGQARRLGGRDKSRLIVRGRSIIVRQLDVLQRVTPRIFIVSSHQDGRFDDLGLPVVPDAVEGVGAIAGLVTALERAETPVVLVVACDLPFLEESVLRLLVDRVRIAEGAWVRSRRGPEPLLACYRASTAPLIRAAIARGERRLSNLDRLLRIDPVTEADIAALGVASDALTNINTPDDLARIQ